MERLPLDIYDVMPEEQMMYLRKYKWHFNKKACEWAVTHMRKKEKDEEEKTKKIDAWSREKVDAMLEKCNVKLENQEGYDHVYVANMCVADFMGRSIEDEKHMALYVKDVIDDVDAPEGCVMRRWYADMVGKGIIVPWEDFA